MTGYRYFIKTDTTEIGFLCDLESYFSENEFFNLAAIFEDELDAPDIDMRNTISFFTQKGNRKFHKAIKKCQTAYEQLGIQFVRIEKEINESEIVYQDKYQIILRR